MEENNTYNNIIESLNNGQEEVVRGISLNTDGSYVVEHSKSLQEIMSIIQEWLELVDSIKKGSLNFQLVKSDNKSIDTTSNNSTEQSNEINLSVYIQSAYDKLGHTIKRGAICPVCGKRLKYMPMGGYCSVECMIKDISAKATGYLTKPNEKYKEYYEVIDNVKSILDMLSLTINAIVLIPNIIKELAVVPDEYKQYVILKINEAFCDLEILIQKFLEKKNELLRKLLDKAKLGIITKPLSYILVGLDTIQKGIDYAKEGIDIGYNAAIKALESLAKVPGGTAIEAESFAFAATPRSFLSPMPITSPDTSKLFVNIPGGNGSSLEIMKSTMPSAISSLDMNAIDSAIQELFPPLTSIDYYLDPELFKIRFLMSDQSNLVKQIRQQIEDFLSAGPDYLPKYENLLPVKKFIINNKEIWLPNVGYLWFIAGLADGWAPHSQSLVGSFIHPEI